MVGRWREWASSRRRRRDGASLTGPSRPRLARRGARDASVVDRAPWAWVRSRRASYRGRGGVLSAATRRLGVLNRWPRRPSRPRGAELGRSDVVSTASPGSAAPRAPRGDSWGRRAGLPLLSTRRAHEEPHRSRLVLWSFTQTVHRVRLGGSVRLEWPQSDAVL